MYSFRVQGLGLRVTGSGFRAKGLGSRVRVKGLGLCVGNQNRIFAGEGNRDFESVASGDPRVIWREPAAMPCAIRRE